VSSAQNVARTFISAVLAVVQVFGNRFVLVAEKRRNRKRK